MLTFDVESPAVVRAAQDSNHLEWLSSEISDDIDRLALARAMGASFIALVSQDSDNKIDVHLAESATSQRVWDLRDLKIPDAAFAVEQQADDALKHPTSIVASKPAVPASAVPIADPTPAPPLAPVVPVTAPTVPAVPVTAPLAPAVPAPTPSPDVVKPAPASTVSSMPEPVHVVQVSKIPAANSDLPPLHVTAPIVKPTPPPVEKLLRLSLLPLKSLLPNQLDITPMAIWLMCLPLWDEVMMPWIVAMWWRRFLSIANVSMGLPLARCRVSSWRALTYRVACRIKLWMRPAAGFWLPPMIKDYKIS